MCINENKNGVLFLALVDKGFSKPVAFNCLDQIKGDFDKTFDDEAIKKAKPYELSEQFSGVMAKAYVSKIVLFRKILIFLFIF